MLRNIIIVSTIIILLVIGILIGVDSKMDMFIYPFYAEIWGTISDWIMVMVTALTAWFLWRTLRSQQIVQSAQTDLTQLEFRRYRESILPVWQLEITKDVNLNDNGVEHDIDYIMVIKLRTGQAHNISITWVMQGINSALINPLTAIFTNTQEGFTFRCFYHGFIPNPGLNGIEASIIFTVQYQDNMNNNYSQLLEFGLLESNEDVVRSRAPILN